MFSILHAGIMDLGIKNDLQACYIFSISFQAILGIFGINSFITRMGPTYNPFALLSMRLLHSLIASGNTWIVRQTYKRGLELFDEHTKAAFLFTHYNNLHEAQMHYNALHQDAHRFLYDNNNPEHRAKLEIAAKQPPGYKVYSSLLEQPWKPSEKMAEKIRRYIGENLTWTPARADTIAAELFTRFGELFVTLNYNGRSVKVPLADIEKY